MPVSPLAPEVAAFYGTQSGTSDPGAHAGLYEGLPRDVGELARVVRGVMLHRVEGGQFGVPIAEDRMRDDAETRYVDDILALVAERDGRALSCRREWGDRFIGICRDFTLLHVSLLRHQGTPARLRSGFADYFSDSGFHWDHVVTEYWDDARGWLLADPQIADPERYTMDFDPMDVPRDRFLVAGDAWQRIRAGQVDPESFGLALDVDPKVGSWFVAGNIRLDLAALNKVETLLWDIWGTGADSEKGMTDAIRVLYDEAAAVVAGTAPDFAALRRLFTGNEGLRTPSTVLSLAPLRGPSQVTLR
ncbi:transglutaminase-like domain-containing protein [Actinacidiphila bryophytorum]|uniref:transglutaminase-like domain-containing protein n=1 Tax=Actinacidiphila bryophytorum TaxID=1436133 RepID=UPI002176AA1F|nr:transglutaminase-like domain-containing protein [Actinacidiphila bryophytorum]UWE12677.1 transglutaminase-like domain-containing protein [Actinacidiphila bryophytorum]